jgi:putative membrane protein
MYYDHMYGFGGGWGLLGLLAMCVFWVILILVIVLLVRAAAGGRHRHMRHWHDDSHTSALSILEERYAKGEISKEEFVEKKKDLQG